jgi:iron-sulfur cluster assembly protein CyaY
MTLSEEEFHDIADATLRRLMELLDNADDAEADLRDGVLTIEPDSGGQYIVNKHAPNKEIWVSSPKSGAWHFAYDAARKAWADTRNRGGDSMTLEKLMAGELDVPQN